MKEDDDMGTATKPVDTEYVVDANAALATRADRPLTVEDLMAKAIERGDTETMEKLFAMRREMRTESAEMAFNAAMTKAQKEIKHVAANKKNSQTNSRYADYDALDKVLRPIYTANGFALSFNTGDIDKPDTILVLCEVSHEAGFSKRYQAPMPADGKGAKGGDVMTKTHATGAAMSYGMRYLLKMIFNVAIGEDDTDGNEGDYERITESQAADLRSLIEETKTNLSAFLKWAQIDKVENIRATQFKPAIVFLEAKRKYAAEKGK